MKKNRNNKLRRIAIVIGVLISSSILQIYMQSYEDFKYELVGNLVDINSKKIHLYESGSGEYSIAFLAGSGTPSAYTDFYYLQSELSNQYNTICFDYPGFGWSDSTEIDRTIDNMTTEMKEVLNKSNQRSPYFLVAHSLASLEAIRFAQMYPDEVAGIVFLDGGSPDYYAKLKEWEPIVINRFLAVLRVTGINRIMGYVGIKLPAVGENLRSSLLPDEVKNINDAMYYKFIGNSNNIESIKNINENAKVVMDNGILENIPILVLSAASDDEWNSVQNELLNFSNENNRRIIEDADHYMHWSNKETVITEIRKFIDEIKGG